MGEIVRKSYTFLYGDVFDNLLESRKIRTIKNGLLSENSPMGKFWRTILWKLQLAN